MTPIWVFAFPFGGRAMYPYINTRPQLLLGHVGISLDGRRIWGFSPFAPEIEPVELVQRLQRHKSFPGIVQDDTALFHQAQDLADEGYPSQVWMWEQNYSWLARTLITWPLRGDVRRSPMDDKSYQLPPPNRGCYNCGTYPLSIGVTLPERSGNMTRLMRAIQEKGGYPWQR